MKNNTIIIDEYNNKAFVTKVFANRARIFGSPEFKKWREVTALYNGIEMVIRKPKRQNAFKLTYENMETFINSQPDSKKLIKEFEKVKASSKLTRSPFSYVKKWFEEKFKDNETYIALKNNPTENQEPYEEKASA